MNTIAANLAGMTFAAKLEMLIQSRGVRQVDLAGKLQVQANRITKWKDGTGQPRPADLLAMARAFRVPVEFLCDEDATDPDAPVRTTARYPDLIGIIDVIGEHEARRRLLLDPSLGTQKSPPTPAENGGIQGAVGRRNRVPKSPKPGPS